MDWKEQKNTEMQFLKAEYEKRPELFEMETFVDDAEFLGQFGIMIPNKENFPRAYLKFLPQDFIVEEVTKDGILLSADKQSNLPAVDSEGETVYATLVKCNITTFDAIKEIARQLGTEPTQIQYAGIKDKAAITSQRISIRKIPKDKVEAVTSEFFFLKDVVQGKGVIERGGLTGNRFTILLRTESTTETQKEILLKAFDEVMKGGFYNFFYLQRFASPRLTNYRWGYHVLTGNYAEAVKERLFAPGLRESKYFQELRKSLEKYFGDWPKVMEGFAPFPLICQQEHAVLNHLLKNPTDYIGALKQIPDQVSLWIQSLDALLYNQLLSNLIMRNQVPATLPTPINNVPSHWQPYRDELQGLAIFPPPVKNLQPFAIHFGAPILSTIDHPKISDIKIVPNGVIMQFELKKGEYATTFLSHMFNILSGKPTEHMSREPENIKVPLGDNSFEETLKIFAPIIRPKVDNFLEIFKGQE